MTRYVAGRLNGIDAEPGTILGPKDITREYMVVLDRDERGVILGYATADDLQAAADRDEPQSVAEIQLRRRAGGDRP